MRAAGLAPGPKPASRKEIDFDVDNELELALPSVIQGLMRVVPKATVMCTRCSTRGCNAPTHPIHIAATMRKRAKESHRLLRHAYLDSESTGDSRGSGSRRQSLFMAGRGHNCHTQVGNPICCLLVRVMFRQPLQYPWKHAPLPPCMFAPPWMAGWRCLLCMHSVDSGQWMRPMDGMGAVQRSVLLCCPSVVSMIADHSMA
jgi:hypothetical protein